MKKMILATALFAFSMATRADYWMTFCRLPGGTQTFSQTGYVKPDADGFVTIKSGYGEAAQTVVVHKMWVWYRKMPGNPPAKREE